MSKFHSTLILSMFLLLSLTACGSGGSGGSSSTTGSSSTAGESGTPSNPSASVSSATLAWDAPLDSAGIIAGYNLYYGTSSGNYDKKINTGKLTTCTIKDLAPGTYYMAVTCYDASGNESGFSNETTKTVQ